MTRRVMTDVATPLTMRAPVGQFANAREYPTASFKDVTAPNADTLYSAAWLDLSREPYILRVPDEAGHFYLMPMLGGWINVFASPGKRTTGTKAADYAITGPHWKGALPRSVAQYKSPTDLVWIIGRTYSPALPRISGRFTQFRTNIHLSLSALKAGPISLPRAKSIRT